MKVAVLTIAYREDKFINAVLKNWQGKVHKHLVLESKIPWHGHELPEDRTREIVAKYPHAEYITLNWRSEAIQRNWGLARLYEYDYVLIVDADELYEERDQLTILESIGRVEKYQDNTWAYRTPHVQTYFKTPDYVLDPPDTHEPIIAVNPKKVTFTEHRQVTTDYLIPIEVTMHHLTYLRDDLRLYHKLQQFEHYDQVKKNWFEEKWKQWTPDTEDVRSYGQEKSKAIRYPLPDELRALLSGEGG